MTLYYSLVFVLLVAEMTIFMLLIVPLPFTWRRKLFNFISESPIVAKLQYGMKITFIFILILFIDSVNRVYRVQVELASAAKQGGQAEYEPQTLPYRPTVNTSLTYAFNNGRATVLGGSQRMEVQARKFYSQRNMYLCGFTLFLSLILNRTYVMILDVLRLEEKIKRYEGDSATKGKDSQKLAQAGNAGEIGKLKNQLAEKDRDLETLKKQSEGLNREYGNLSDQYGRLNQDGTPRKDL